MSLFQTGFRRMVFTAAQLRQVRECRDTHVDRTRSPLPRTLSRYFSSGEINAILAFVFGPEIVKILYHIDEAMTRTVTAALLDDLVKENDTPPKDLQLSLMVNCIVQFVRNQDLLRSKRDGEAERLLRLFILPDDFKLQVKQELFDNDALGRSSYLIYRYK